MVARDVDDELLLLAGRDVVGAAEVVVGGRDVDVEVVVDGRGLVDDEVTADAGREVDVTVEVLTRVVVGPTMAGRDGQQGVSCQPVGQGGGLLVTT